MLSRSSGTISAGSAANVPDGVRNPQVELIGVRKEFGSGIVAVESADLTVADGELFAILGPSGSGKTTVLRMIAGFEQPTAGTIKLGGIVGAQLADPATTFGAFGGVLQSGSVGSLTITGDIETSRKENVLALPSIAVMRDETSAYVMLDKGSGQYERRDIKTGLETTDKTEVLEGLKEGDTVALQ